MPGPLLAVDRLTAAKLLPKLRRGPARKVGISSVVSAATWEEKMRAMEEKRVNDVAQLQAQLAQYEELSKQLTLIDDMVRVRPDQRAHALREDSTACSTGADSASSPGPSAALGSMPADVPEHKHSAAGRRSKTLKKSKSASCTLL